MGALARVPSSLMAARYTRAHRPRMCPGWQPSGRLGDGAVDPGHEPAQLAPDLLDRVLLACLHELREVRPARLVLGHPLLREDAVLGLSQALAHLSAARGR